MTTPFDSDEPRHRLVETRYGDTMRAIAYRELGDAQRWVELVWLNNLQAPYLTNDPDEASDSVILAGASIKVPASAGFSDPGISADLAYAKDAALVGRQLQVSEFGDLLVASGVENLKQQLSHRLNTPRGQLINHPRYGSYFWRLIGSPAGAVTALLGAEYVKSTLLADYRVQEVRDAVALIQGDTARVSAVALTRDGAEIPIAVGS